MVRDQLWGVGSLLEEKAQITNKHKNHRPNSPEGANQNSEGPFLHTEIDVNREYMKI